MSAAQPLDAYIRVSAVKGRAGESFISPTVQRDRIEAWAALHDRRLVWHEPELDVTGGRMDRPIFDKIMARIRSGETGGVVVAKLDRFARTLVGALGVLEEFEAHNAILVSVQDNIDLSTPVGKAFLRILLVFAELERDRISESWKTATASAVARGIHIAKYTPIGYEKTPEKRLQPGPDAAAVREAFLMRAAHHTRTQIAHRLDQLAPRPNGGCWTPPMVDRIIKNRVYMGHAYRGSETNPDAHPALVTVAEWHAANNAPVRAAARGKKPNLLGGIARCHACRYVLAPGKSRFGGTGEDVLGYRCRGTHTAGTCPAPASINARKLETHIETIWRQQMAREAFLIQPDTDALHVATDDLQAAEQELTAFANDLTARDMLGAGYHAALNTRAQAVDDAKAQLNDATAGQGRTTGQVARYEELPVEDRKRILSASIDAIIIQRGHSRTPIQNRVTILWRGEGPNDLPRRGRDNGPIRPYSLQP
jgi:DNA invertase Pin-like site-specific DNA recombinase